MKNYGKLIQINDSAGHILKNINISYRWNFKKYHINIFHDINIVDIFYVFFSWRSWKYMYTLLTSLNWRAKWCLYDKRSQSHQYLIWLVLRVFISKRRALSLWLLIHYLSHWHIKSSITKYWYIISILLSWTKYHIDIFSTNMPALIE